MDVKKSEEIEIDDNIPHNLGAGSDRHLGWKVEALSVIHDIEKHVNVDVMFLLFQTRSVKK